MSKKNKLNVRDAVNSLDNAGVGTAVMDATEAAVKAGLVTEDEIKVEETTPDYADGARASTDFLVNEQYLSSKVKALKTKLSTVESNGASDVNPEPPKGEVPGDLPKGAKPVLVDVRLLLKSEANRRYTGGESYHKGLFGLAEAIATQGFDPTRAIVVEGMHVHRGTRRSTASYLAAKASENSKLFFVPAWDLSDCNLTELDRLRIASDRGAVRQGDDFTIDEIMEFADRFWQKGNKKVSALAAFLGLSQTGDKLSKMIFPLLKVKDIDPERGAKLIRAIQLNRIGKQDRNKVPHVSYNTGKTIKLCINQDEDRKEFSYPRTRKLIAALCDTPARSEVISELYKKGADVDFASIDYGTVKSDKPPTLGSNDPRVQTHKSMQAMVIPDILKILSGNPAEYSQRQLEWANSELARINSFVADYNGDPEAKPNKTKMNELAYVLFFARMPIEGPDSN